MAKGNKKPQRHPKAASSSQPVVSLPLATSPHTASEHTANSSPTWWGKLYDHWVEAVVGGFLAAGFIGCLLLVLTEYREHEGTKAQLARTGDDKQQATDERNRLQKELENLQKENDEIKKLHPILEFYGPRAKFTANYDLKKEIGSRIITGRCPGEPCIVLTLREIKKGEDGALAARLSLAGKWMGF